MFYGDKPSNCERNYDHGKANGSCENNLVEIRFSAFEPFVLFTMLFFAISIIGNNRYYPDQVEWIYTKVSKEKAREHTSNTVDMAEYLEEDEVQKLIESIHSVQKKAFIACMYESALLT